MIPFHKVTGEQRESFSQKVNSIDTIYFVLRYSQHGGVASEKFAVETTVI